MRILSRESECIAESSQTEKIRIAWKFKTLSLSCKKQKFIHSKNT
jgi:hypothetical protein